MQVTAIKYTLINNPEPVAYRFAARAGERQNIFSHVESEGNLLNLVKAFRSVFSLETGVAENISSVQVQLTDGNGDVWVVSKKGRKIVCFCNNKPIVENLQNTKIAQFLDLDPTTPALKHYTLKIDSGDLSAEDLTLDNEDMSISSKNLRGKLKAFIDTFAEILTPERELTPKETLHISTELDHIHRRFIELNHTYQNLKNDLPLRKVKSEQIAKITQEIKLIDKIKNCVEFLKDPKNCATMTQEKLGQINQQIEEHLLKLQSTPKKLGAISTLNWDQIATNFSRIKTQEIFAREIKSAHEKATEESVTISERLIHVIHTVMENESQILAELNLCLKKSTPNPSKLSTLLKKTMRTLKLERNRPHGTNENHLAVEYGISRLSELRTMPEHITSTISTSLHPLLTYARKIDDQQQSLKENLETHLNEQGITPPTSMKELVTILEQIAQLAYLEKSRELWENQLASYRTTFKQLEGLLESYFLLQDPPRKSTSTSKTQLLTEAGNIAATYEQKTQKLEKLVNDQHHNLIINELYQKIKTSIFELSEKWTQILSAHSLGAKSITDHCYVPLFMSCRDLNLLMTYCTQENLPIYGKKVFSSEVMSAPLTIFCLKNSALENQERIQILDYLNSASRLGNAIIMTCDTTLASMMEGIGITQSIKLKQKKPEPVAINEGSVMTKKAEEILKILTSQKTPSKLLTPTIEKTIKSIGGIRKSTSP